MLCLTHIVKYMPTNRTYKMWLLIYSTDDMVVNMYLHLIARWCHPLSVEEANSQLHITSDEAIRLRRV